MFQARALRKLLSRFYEKPVSDTTNSAVCENRWNGLSDNEKEILAEEFLVKGEMDLLHEDHSAIDHFESAALLAPKSADIWYRGAVAFYHMGQETNQEQAFLIASRYLKIASQLAPDRFAIWACWGSALFQLGAAYNEHHYYLEAKEKLQKAISFASTIPRAQLARLYWDYGLVWTELAQHSGEAVDVRIAIQSFENAMNFLDSQTPAFLNDCGVAYLHMGLLIGDARLYLQAIHYLRRAIEIDHAYTQGWTSLANAYSQLYLNTLDEQYATLGSDCFAYLCQHRPNEVEYWLGWGQLLGEAGKQNRDPKKLSLSIEKCAQGSAVNPSNPLIISQWVESLSYLGKITNQLEFITEAENKVIAASDQYPDDPDLWYAYGICLMSFGSYFSDPDYYDFAIEKLQHGLSIDRTHAEIWHALALTHFSLASIIDDNDLIDRAIRFFQRAIDLKPLYPPLIFDTANAYLFSFQMKADIDSLQHAISLFENLLQIQKEALLNHSEWIYRYAIALEAFGDHSDNESYFVRALDLYFHVLLLDPETEQIHFHIAMCLTRFGETSGESEYIHRAMHHFRLASRQDEEDEEVWLEWGLCSVLLSELTIDPEIREQSYLDAERKILRAGQLGNTNAHYSLASLYSLTSRTDEAIVFLKKALDASSLPPIDEILEDERMDHLRHTMEFAEFISKLETKREN